MMFVFIYPFVGILIFEALALLFSLFALYPSNRKQRPLLYIMVVIAITETIAAINYPKPNYIIYSISHILVGAGYFYFFYKSLNSSQYKMLIKYMVGVFYIFAVINIIFIQNYMLATYNFITMGVLLSIVSLFYFIEVLNDSNKVNLFSDPLFWVGCAVILYYLPKSAIFSSYDTFCNMKGMDFRYFLDKANLLLSSILYTLISIACICKLIPQRSSRY